MTAGNPPSGLGDYVAILRRRWILVATIVPAVIFIFCVFAFGLPALYRSSATLILEASSIQEKLIATTVTSYADQQIELVQGRVMDPQTLEQLIQSVDLYPSNNKWGAGDKAREILLNTEIERVDAVTLEPLKKSNAFSLHYSNPNPDLAAIGAQQLADLFLSYHQKVRADAAREAATFLAQQAESISAELEKVDQEVAQLKARYGDALPTSQERNQASKERSERELESLERELRNAQEKESLLAIQLSGLSPRMLTRSGDLTDLATVRAQLAEAQQKYTPDHPDVKRLQRALESIMAQGGKTAAGSQSQAVNADNPEYLRVSGQLDAARRDVSALRISVERTRVQVYQYSGLLQSAPGMERQFSELERRRTVLQTQFQEIQGKLREARLGQLFESEKRGERFTMVRAPIVPSNPYSPNRIGLILLGVVLGFAACAIVLAIVESADPSVRGLRDVAIAGQWPVLGSVPEILVDSDRRRRRWLYGGLCASYVVGIIIVAGLVIRAERNASNAMTGAAANSHVVLESGRAP